MRVQTFCVLALAGVLSACGSTTSPTPAADALVTPDVAMATAPAEAGAPTVAAASGAPLMAAADMTLENLPGEKATGEILTTPSGLRYVVLKEGVGDKPTKDSTVTVNYNGFLTNGTTFDSSYDRGEPATFPLNGVIAGWTEGLQLVSPGGKIKLIVPSDLGYGANGYPPVIPGNATLVFDVELLPAPAPAAP